MDPLSLILLAAALGAIAKAGVDHAVREYGKSRTARMKLAEKEAAPKGMSKLHKRRVASRHATGWWAREISRGFPFTRTGIHSGLLAHRTATDHLRVRREEERTTHLETRGAFLKALPEHRKRQAAAQAGIDAALLAAGEPVRGKGRLKTVLDSAAIPLRRGDGTPVWEPPAEGPRTPPAVAAPLPHETVSGRAPEGALGAAVPLPSELAKPGANGTWTPRPRTPLDTYQTPVTPGTTTAPPMEGAPPMAAATDTTFTQIKADAAAGAAHSDQDTATIRGRKDAAYATADAMVAAGADPVAVQAQMEYADRLHEAEKALASAGESATLVPSVLDKYHGGMQEAHDSAPGAVATREFHGGS